MNESGRAVIADGVTWPIEVGAVFTGDGRGPVTMGFGAGVDWGLMVIGVGVNGGGTNGVRSFRTGPTNLGVGTDSRRSATGRVSGFDTAARQSCP